VLHDHLPTACARPPTAARGESPSSPTRHPGIECDTKPGTDHQSDTDPGAATEQHAEGYAESRTHRWCTGPGHLCERDEGSERLAPSDVPQLDTCGRQRESVDHAEIHGDLHIGQRIHKVGRYDFAYGTLSVPPDEARKRSSWFARMAARESRSVQSLPRAPSGPDGAVRR
jgi:hypothetical protein